MLTGQLSINLQSIIIMCEPTSITAATMMKISLATTVASTAMSMMAQQQAARNQADAQKAAAKRENERYLREASAMRLKEAQEDLVMTRDIQESQKKATAARSTAMVSAGESGVSGLSVDALMDDYTRQEADYRYSLSEQNRLTGINNQLQLTEAGFRSSNNLIKINKPIQQPNYLGSMVNLAGSTMTIYGQGKQNLYAEKKAEALG